MLNKIYRWVNVPTRNSLKCTKWYYLRNIISYVYLDDRVKCVLQIYRFHIDDSKKVC